MLMCTGCVRCRCGWFPTVYRALRDPSSDSW